MKPAEDPFTNAYACLPRRSRDFAAVRQSSAASPAAYEQLQLAPTVTHADSTGEVGEHAPPIRIADLKGVAA